MLFTITAISFLRMAILYTMLFTLMLYGVIKMLYVFFHIIIFIVIALSAVDFFLLFLCVQNVRRCWK